MNGIRFDHPQGLFKILTPPEGEFRVVIRADGFAPNVMHVQGASGKKLVVPEIRLGDGEHVLAEVVDAETDVPIRDARASLADPAKLERLRFIRPERVAVVVRQAHGVKVAVEHQRAAATGPARDGDHRRAPGQALEPVDLEAAGAEPAAAPVRDRRLPRLRQQLR